MQTRSSSRHVSTISLNPTPSTNPNPKGCNRRRSKQRIEDFNLEELSPPIVTMADQRTMAQLLQAPTEGYEDAIVVPAITADNFELKHGLLTLVQNKQFFGHDQEDLHAHVRYFNKITSTLKFLNVPNTVEVSGSSLSSLEASPLPKTHTTALQKVYVSQWSVTNVSHLDDGRVCREMVDEFAPPKFFASVHGMEHDQLFTKFNVRVARQMSLSVEVMEGEIKNLKAKMLLREAEAGEAIRLRAEASNLEAVGKSIRDETNTLNERNAILEKEQYALDVKVTTLEAAALEKFQDDRMKVVNDKFDKLYTDFVEMTFHLEEKFYPHLLTTISGCRWLLTHGMELAIVNCLNSPQYLSALGTAIGKAIEKVTEGTSNSAAATAETTAALSTTFASASTIAPISVDNYEVIGVDDQTVANENAASFPNVRGSCFPSRSLNLYAPFPSAFVTSYGPSHLGPSFLVSSARLASLLRYTRSTSAVLSVGIPISAWMTASVPYVNENRVSPLLDSIMAIGLRMFNRSKVLADT
nr:reverse transcriptase domain-containing protein [Tanacetum cinerariifolium]